MLKDRFTFIKVFLKGVIPPKNVKSYILTLRPIESQLKFKSPQLKLKKLGTRKYSEGEKIGNLI